MGQLCPILFKIVSLFINILKSGDTCMPGFITQQNTYYEADTALHPTDVEVELRPSTSHIWNADRFSWVYHPDKDRRALQQVTHVIQERQTMNTENEESSKVNVKTLLSFVGICLTILIPVSTAMLKLYNDQTVLKTEFIAYKTEDSKMSDRLEKQLKEIQNQLIVTGKHWN